MDIQLPGKDGFALLAEIRASPQAALRVVALTAHAMTGDRDRAGPRASTITSPSRSTSRFPDQVARVLAGQPNETREPG